MRTGSSVSMAELKTKSALFCEGMGSREALCMRSCEHAPPTSLWRRDVTLASTRLPYHSMHGTRKGTSSLVDPSLRLGAASLL